MKTAADAARQFEEDGIAEGQLGLLYDALVPVVEAPEGVGGAQEAKPVKLTLAQVEPDPTWPH